MTTDLQSACNLELSQRQGKQGVPSPSYRHAAPSAPWPWVDIDDPINDEQRRLMNAEAAPIPDMCDHADCDNCWTGYPQSRFPNWTTSQVIKSGIAQAIRRKSDEPCICYHIDVDTKGLFRNAARLTHLTEDEDTWWELLSTKRPKDSRTRAIFIENLSGPMLQMLGTKYNIEPFFFSSSLDWIPSRFQEDLQPKEGDHITITLTFLRSVPKSQMSDYKAATKPYSDTLLGASHESISSLKHEKPLSSIFEESIDTKAPLKLRNLDRYLVLDLLSLHLIRGVDENTIISYHPNLDLPTTTAQELHERMRFAGQAVYWQKMFQKSRDPTLLLLAFFWHALYSWDQALEHLYNYICSLESHVIHTSKWRLTQDLHIIRAHQLYYTSLLDDFQKSVEFVEKAENPAMNSDKILDCERELNRKFIKRECENLLLEIQRLEKDLIMQEKRLKNVMNLVFCSVNITDSKLMFSMTEAAVRDSAAMKQIAYLTMIFLPASFVAGCFGMNVNEIAPDTNGTLTRYFSIALPLTILTIWIIIAFQSRYLLSNKSFFERLWWPWLLAKQRFGQFKETKERRRNIMDRTIGEDYNAETDLRVDVEDFV